MHDAAQQGVGRFDQAVRPVDRGRQAVLVPGVQAVEHLAELTQPGGRPGGVVAFVHDHHIKQVAVEVRIQAAHGLYGGEGDALSDIHLALCDGTQQSRVHVPFSPFLALAEQVRRVRQPQGPALKALNQGDAHLGLSAPGGTLQDAVPGVHHPGNGLFLVVIQWYFLRAVVHVHRLREVRLHIRFADHGPQAPQGAKGQVQTVADPLVQSQLLRGIPGPESHPALLLKVRIGEDQMFFAPLADLPRGIVNGDHFIDGHIHSFALSFQSSRLQTSLLSFSSRQEMLLRCIVSR